MIISVINHTNGLLLDEQVQRAIRAVNRQIVEDFEPYWSMGARLRLEGPTELNPDKNTLSDMRGDAVLYLWDEADIPNALGYHARNNDGIPYGFVFIDLIQSLGENWTVTLSHEALEMIADPETNLLVQGPHPEDTSRDVFHWYEMCDAVQTEVYRIDDVEVSNFVLPLYFTGGEETGGRNDFLGRNYGGHRLTSFGLNPGGYVGFYDPQIQGHSTFSLPGDALAARRAEIKLRAKEARRAERYAKQRTGESFTKYAKLEKKAEKKVKRKQVKKK